MELYAFKRNNFILNKFFPCLIITMFAIMCLYGSSVYATFSENLTEISINDINYEIDIDYILHSYPYYFLTSQNDKSGSYYNTNLVLLLSNEPLIVDHSTSNTYIQGDLLYIRCTTGSQYNSSYSYSSIISLWNNIQFDTTLGTHSYSSDPYIYQGSGSGYSCSNCNFIFSNYDLKNSNNELVFQGAPPLTALVGIVERQEMKPLQEILGILPVVIVVLVGLIAIRKGIQFLMARMKKV